jgi:hypothetical protein
VTGRGYELGDNLMINDLDIVQWDYLLSPEFEMVNSAGKPLTGGYIEVYIHGTRNKYYCASDFNGTLHPFQIPLDSLGSNIVLASPDNAYDVYVYNKYGSLIMSRYNVHCQGTGGGGGSYTGDKLFYGQYTAHNVAETASLSKTKGNINLDSDGYLQLKQGMSYHITVRGAFQVDDVTNTETTLNYIEYSTISPIKVDVDFTKADPQNFELSYDIYDLAEDMAYQVAFEQINGMVTDLVVEVHSLSNLATTATFNYEAGDYISIVDNTISVTGINPEDYSTHSETYESIVTAIQLVTGIVPDNAATHDEVYEATVTAINFVTGIIPETQVQSDWDQTDDTQPDYIQNKPDLDIYATHGEVNESITTAINFVTGAIPTPEQELPLVAGDGITITEYEDRVEIAANVTSIDGYATLDDVAESAVTSIQLVTGMIPDVSDFITHDEVNTVSGEIIEVTTEIVNNVSGDIIETVNNVSSVLHEEIQNIPEQQQADWDQSDDTQVDYIKNKPDLNIYATHDEVTSAVTSIDLSNYATNTEVYEATVTAVQVATGAIPEEEEVEFEEIDLNDYALASAIPDVSNYATHEEVHESIVTAMEYVTGIIPEAQVQSNWTETDNEDPSYIQNKPNELPLVAGDGITITEDLDHITITANVTSIDGYATIEEVNTVSSTIIETVNNVSGVLHEEIQNIPEQVQADWDETNTSSKAYIKNKPTIPSIEGLATESFVTGYVEEAISEIPEYTAGDYISIENNEINVTGLQPEGDYATQTDLIEAVSAVTGIGDYGQFYSTNITGAATMSKIKGTIEVTNDGKIKLKKGQSYHVTVRGRYNQTSPTNVYGDVSYIEYITGQSIHVNVDKSITDSQYFEISYDLYKLSNDSDYYVFLSMNGGTVNDLFIEIHAIGSVGVGGSGGGGGIEYDAGWGIQILNNVISVNPSIIPVVTGFATKEELQDGLEAVTAIIPEAQVQSDWTETDNTDPSYIQNKPDEKSLIAGDGISITVNGTDVIISSTVTGTPVVTGYVTDEELQDAVEFVTGLIPDVSDLATHAEVNNVSGAIVNEIPDVSDFVTEAQVTAMLPEEEEVEFLAVEAGSGINIVQSTTGIIISCSVTGGSGASYTAGNGIDITNNEISIDNTVALKTDIPVVTGYVTDEELQDGLEVVTGLIPNYTAGDYISIENNEISVTGTEDLTMKNLTAGEGIVITESGNNIVISSSVTGTPVVTGYVTDEELQDAVELVTGLIPTDYATDEELQDGIELVTGMIPELPDEEEVEFEEIDLNNYALASSIPDVSNLATKAELQDGLELVTGLIPDISNLATKAELQDGLEVVTGLIPDTSTFATHAEVNNVSGAIVNEIPDVSDFVTEAQVTALIPEEKEVDFLAVSGGNCIEITSDVSGNAEIAWHTTAGITDIQMVTALPASPVSSILYIIPEA